MKEKLKEWLTINYDCLYIGDWVYFMEMLDKAKNERQLYSIYKFGLDQYKLFNNIKFNSKYEKIHKLHEIFQEFKHDPDLSQKEQKLFHHYDLIFN